MNGILNFFFKNTGTQQTLIKNSSWLLAGKFSGSMLRALLVIVSARLLGADLYGSFALAMSFALIVQVFADFGFSTILIREIVQNPERRNAYFSTALVADIAASAGVLLFAVFGGKMFIGDSVALAVLPVITLAVLLDVLREFTNALFRAEEAMEYQAVTHVLGNVALLIGGLVLVSLDLSPQALANGYLLGMATGLLLTSLAALRFFRFTRPDWSFLPRLFHASWPVGIANALFLLLLYVDTLILGQFRSSGEVGLYAATVKFNEFFVLFPQVVALAAFPRFSRFVKDRARLSKATEFSLSIAFLFAFPIVLGGTLFAKDLLLLVYRGGFFEHAGTVADPLAAATLSARLLLPSMLFAFPASILLNVLIALDKRQLVLGYDALILLFNVAANLILVPQYGFLASALLTTVTAAFSFLAAYLIARRIFPFSFLKTLSKPACASFIMAAVIAVLRLPLIAAVPIGAVVYFASLAITRGLPKIKGDD